MDLSSIYHSVSSIQVIRLAVGYEEWRVEAHGQIKDALKVGFFSCWSDWVFSYSDKNRLEGYGVCAAVTRRRILSVDEITIIES